MGNYECRNPKRFDPIGESNVLRLCQVRASALDRGVSLMVRDHVYDWDVALERALRYYVYAKRKCYVYRDEQKRWRSIVILGSRAYNV